jgi:hypothetical protein
MIQSSKSKKKAAKSTENEENVGGGGGASSSLDNTANHAMNTSQRSTEFYWVGPPAHFMLPTHAIHCRLSRSVERCPRACKGKNTHTHSLIRYLKALSYFFLFFLFSLLYTYKSNLNIRFKKLIIYFFLQLINTINFFLCYLLLTPPPPPSPLPIPITLLHISISTLIFKYF